MKLKHSIVDVPEGDPFANDKLERKQHAVILTQFISSLEEPLTLTVEAGWGHGKSTFLRMWAQHLKNENFSCITFNAWENDFSEDPLIPFVTELGKAISQIDDGSGKTKRILKGLSDRLRKTGIQVAKRTLPVAAKLLTAGILDGEELVKTTAGEAIEKAIEEKFNEYEADRETLGKFKATLSEVVKALQSNGKKLPLVFLIDELDRCRPTYALALLERIKHIFNVDGIAFVISIDREQLLESIRTVYGSGTDAPRYLRRFVDFGYTLPDPQSEKYPRHLMSVLGFNDEFMRVTRDGYAAEQFIQTFIALSTCFEMRLRDQEHAFSILSVIWRTMRTGQYIEPFTLATLLVLKVANADMYAKLIKGEWRVAELLSFISSKPAGKDYLENNYGFVLEAVLFLSLESKDIIDEKIAELKAAATLVGANQEKVHKWTVVNNIYQQGGNRRELNKIIQSLEMTQQFVV